MQFYHTIGLELNLGLKLWRTNTKLRSMIIKLIILPFRKRFVRKQFRKARFKKMLCHFIFHFALSFLGSNTWQYYSLSKYMRQFKFSNYIIFSLKSMRQFKCLKNIIFSQKYIRQFSYLNYHVIRKKWYYYDTSVSVSILLLL